jgi:hypothetical protein
MTENPQVSDNGLLNWDSIRLADVVPLMEIAGGYNSAANIVRIDARVRFLWVCDGGHDHRWRVTAWLCNLLR